MGNEDIVPGGPNMVSHGGAKASSRKTVDEALMEAVRAYFYGRVPEVRAKISSNRKNEVLETIANYGRAEAHRGPEEYQPFKFGPKLSFLHRLMEKDSPERDVNFLLYRLIMKLREPLLLPTARRKELRDQLDLTAKGGDKDEIRKIEERVAWAEHELESTTEKFQEELKILLYTSSWSKDFFRSMFKRGNKLAGAILQIMDPQNRSEDGDNYGLDYKEALQQLRHRLQRGLLWKNDPWWPR